MKDRNDNGATWHGLVAVLATMPDSIARLLAEHQPDPQSGRCRACTTPGSGTPAAQWPCPVYRLAEQAQQVRDGGAGR